jgi:hypothetical protein
MAKYRKRPVVVEAHQLNVVNMEYLEEWCHGSIKGISLPKAERCIDIQTLEGEMRAEIDDYIIKGVNGEFYPCKPDIFEKTYDFIE